MLVASFSTTCVISTRPQFRIIAGPTPLDLFHDRLYVAVESFWAGNNHCRVGPKTKGCSSTPDRNIRITNTLGWTSHSDVQIQSRINHTSNKSFSSLTHVYCKMERSNYSPQDKCTYAGTEKLKKQKTSTLQNKGEKESWLDWLVCTMQSNEMRGQVVK